MKRLLSVLCLLLLCPLVWAESTATDAWPNWRGASYAGSATDESFTFGSGVGFKVTWKTSTSKRVDTKKIKAEYPTVAEVCTNETTSRRFLISIAKEKK